MSLELLSRTKWSYFRYSQVSITLVKLYYLNDLDHATGVDISDLTAAKDFIALKAEVDKLDINKLFNVPTCLSNLKTKVDNIDLVN